VPAGLHCLLPAPGIVYLTEGDIVRAVAVLGMTAAVFRESVYIYRTRNLRRP